MIGLERACNIIFSGLLLIIITVLTIVSFSNETGFWGIIIFILLELFCLGMFIDSVKKGKDE
jgi:hypothetical protein